MQSFLLSIYFLILRVYMGSVLGQLSGEQLSRGQLSGGNCPMGAVVQGQFTRGQLI